MPFNFITKFSKSTLLVLVSILVHGALFSATWDGDTDVNIGNDANWDVDPEGNAWVFTSTSSVGFNLTNTSAGNNTATSITFSSGTYTITGSLFGSIILNGDIVNNSAGTQTVTGTNMFFQLNGGDHTFNTASGDLVIDAGLLTLSGTPNIIKSGANTLTLSKNNDYSGTTTISAGTLKLTSNGTLGNTTAATTVSSGATLQLESVTNVDEAITISGTGAGSNGALYKSNATTTNVTGEVTMAANSTINVTAGTLRFSDDIAGSNTLTLSGAGTIDLNSSKTYTGATVITGNTLLSNSGGLGTTAGGTTVQSGGKLTVGDGLSIGAEALTLNTGTLAVSGNTAWAGNIALTGSNTIDYNKNGGTALTLAGNLTGTGGVDYNSSGTAGTIIVQGTNTYQGTTNVATGQILQLENEAGLGNGAAAVTTIASGATLKLSNATAMTIANENITITGTGVSSAGAIQNATGSHTISNQVTLGGNSTIAVDTSTDTLTLTGGISGAASQLTKTGAGALLMGGTSTFDKVTVSGGALGGSMNIGANGLVVGSGTTITPGATNAVGNISVAGGTSTWTGAGTFVWEISGGMTSSGNDLIGATGAEEASGNAGSDWDALQFTQGLDMSVLGTGAKLNLGLTNIGTVGYTWGSLVEIPIIQTGTGITFSGGLHAFNKDYFNIDVSNFGTPGFWWLSWDVSYHNNALWITYIAIPEPSTYVTGGFIVLVVAFGARKKLKALWQNKISKKEVLSEEV